MVLSAHVVKSNQVIMEEQQRHSPTGIARGKFGLLPMKCQGNQTQITRCISSKIYLPQLGLPWANLACHQENSREIRDNLLIEQMFVETSSILHYCTNVDSPILFSNHVIMEHETDNPVYRRGQGDEEWKRPFS